MNPEPPIIEPSAREEDLPYVALWRNIVFSVFVIVVVAPAAWLLAIFLFALVGWVKPENVIEYVAALPAALAAYGVIRRNMTRGWGTSNLALLGWGLLAALSAIVADGVQKLHVAQQEIMIKKNLQRLDEAENLLFKTDHEKLFFAYDDVVGPGKPVAELTVIRGEDYRGLYPRHIGQTFCVDEPQSSIMWFPFETTNPPGDWSNPRRCNLPGGGCLEYDENNSRHPHGAVRFYRANGKLWAEAQCQAGRLTGPAWIITPDGKRRDALDLAKRGK